MVVAESDLRVHRHQLPRHGQALATPESAGGACRPPSLPSLPPPARCWVPVASPPCSRRVLGPRGICSEPPVWLAVLQTCVSLQRVGGVGREQTRSVFFPE